MHPRNMYRYIDFKELTKEFSELERYTTIDLKGQVHVNFKDLEALRTLSKILLKRDFNLDIHFPSTRLIPTIPLRLNYILFIEDLVNDIITKKCIHGLDIGTGASCIYPLITAKKNGWRMVGTDINSDSVNFAQQNITVNNLNHLVEVVQVKQDTVLKEILKRDSIRYDFCMCNPPFFGGVNELCSQLKRTAERPIGNNAFVAEMHEVVTEGGEVQFVSKMIDESVRFQDRIKIYTSMLGLKRNIKPLLTKLSEIPDVKSTITTEFHQGNTTRFCIAWTFDNLMQFKKMPHSKEKRMAKDKPYVYSIQRFNGTIQHVDNKLEEIFNELDLEYTKIKKDDNVIIFKTIAYRNTWSHSRRRRRELMRKTQSVHESEILKSTYGTNKVMNLKILADTKSLSNEPACSTNINLLKRKFAYVSQNNAKRSKLYNNEVKDKYLETSIFVYKYTELKIAVNYVNGLGGRNASHELLQYIKNNINL